LSSANSYDEGGFPLAYVQELIRHSLFPSLFRHAHQTERNRMTTAPANTILFTVLLIAFVIIASLIVQRQRSLRLKRRFGPEYDLTVAEFRTQAGTETERRTRHPTDQESEKDVLLTTDRDSHMR
jgi:hypothetical protein